MWCNSYPTTTRRGPAPVSPPAPLRGGPARAFHLIATRVLFAMSRDRLVSHHLLTVNAGGTPTRALALSVVVAVAFILSGTFQRVIAVVAFFFVFSYALSFVSTFVLRRREPDLPRPYRVPWWPWQTLWLSWLVFRLTRPRSLAEQKDP